MILNTVRGALRKETSRNSLSRPTKHAIVQHIFDQSGLMIYLEKKECMKLNFGSSAAVISSGKVCMKRKHNF